MNHLQECVLPEECVCEVSGVRYWPGQQMKMGCEICRCERGRPQHCQANPECSGTEFLTCSLSLSQISHSYCETKHTNLTRHPSNKGRIQSGGVKISCLLNMSVTHISTQPPPPPPPPHLSKLWLVILVPMGGVFGTVWCAECPVVFSQPKQSF